MSHRALIDSETSVLDKDLNFVLTPEKIDQFQIKNDFERLGTEIKLKMHFKTERTLAFWEKSALRVPSKWPPPIPDIQLEMYLSEIEERSLSIHKR